MRILVETDSPYIPSGQAKVGREIALGLRDRGHEIGYLGWWHHPAIMAPPMEGIKFWHTNNSHYGSDVFDQVVIDYQPDLVLTVGDFWRLWYMIDPNICKTRKHFQWCSYIPVDGEPIGGGLPPAVIEPIKDIDIPVAYTNYARDAIMKSVFDIETRNRLQVIYHGVDTEIYRPMAREEREKIRKQYGLEDKFLFLTVCRNQSRKNIPEMFQAWKKFSELPETLGKVVFWPHMFFQDPMGWDIDHMLDVFKLRNQTITYYNQVAHARSEWFLLQEQDIAKLYQIADAFLLISGEGFGLPTFEAMATGLPCILLDYAASSELGADGRAELVPSEGSHTMTGTFLTQRPIPRIEDIVNSMLRVYRDRDYRRSIAQKGQEFATQYTWKRVVDEWNHLFTSIEVPFLKPINMEVVA